MKIQQFNFFSTRSLPSKCLTCLMASSILLSSCASMNDRDKTVTQGTAIGATGGAVATGGIFYAIGKIFGLSDRQSAVLATSGAVLGGVLGAQWGRGWGESVVKKKEAYARTEDYLNANINQTNSRVKTLNSANKMLSGQIQSLKNQRAQLVKSQDQAQKKAFNNSIAKTTAEIAAREKLVNKDISNGLAAIRIAKKEGISPQELAKLENGVRTMQGQLATMTGNRKAIARLKL